VNLFERRTVFALHSSTGAYGIRAEFCSVKSLWDAFLAAGFELDERRTLLVALPRPPF
jgi:hypothetical protein